MKLRLLSALILITFLFCGCSSTKFTAYHGAEVFQGKGGEARAVDGMDFYEEGAEPPRKCRVLGSIEESPRHRPPLGRISRAFSSSGSGDSDARDSAIAKLARKEGGDAVVVLRLDPTSSDEDDAGQRKHRRAKKYFVIKYVD